MALSAGLSVNYLLELPPAEQAGRLTPQIPDYITPIYEELLKFLLHSEASSAKMARSHLRDLFNGDPVPILKDNPPTLVVATFNSSAHAISIPLEDTQDMIFINKILHDKLEVAGSRDMAGQPTLASTSVQELAKCALLHALAHWAIHHRVGVMPFPLSSMMTLEEEHITVAERDRRLLLLHTPAKFRVPWAKDPEAGDWIEYQTFGGIVDLDEEDHLIVVTGSFTYSIEMATLLLSHKDVLYNFSSSFDTVVSPSPSSQFAALHSKAEHDDLELEDVGKCGTHRALTKLATSPSQWISWDVDMTLRLKEMVKKLKTEQAQGHTASTIGTL